MNGLDVGSHISNLNSQKFTNLHKKNYFGVKGTGMHMVWTVWIYDPIFQISILKYLLFSKNRIETG